MVTLVVGSVRDDSVEVVDLRKFIAKVESDLLE